MWVRIYGEGDLLPKEAGTVKTRRPHTGCSEQRDGKGFSANKENQTRKQNLKMSIQRGHNPLERATRLKVPTAAESIYSQSSVRKGTYGFLETLTY